MEIIVWDSHNIQIRYDKGWWVIYYKHMDETCQIGIEHITQSIIRDISYGGAEW